MCKKIKSSLYFESADEAIRRYLTSNNDKEKNDLFKDTIDPALKKLIKGVLKMPKFQKIIGVTTEEIEEAAYFHVIFILEKFDVNRKNDKGQLVKPYSYFGTCVKNYILALKINSDKKIAEHGGVLDISDVGFSIEQKKSDFQHFEDLKFEIINLLKTFPEKSKLTKNDIIVNSGLIYMLLNWHSIEFQNDRQFIRLLINYTHLSPSIVSASLKKIKCFLSKNSLNLNFNKKKTKKPYANLGLDEFIEDKLSD